MHRQPSRSEDLALDVVVKAPDAASTPADRSPWSPWPETGDMGADRARARPEAGGAEATPDVAHRRDRSPGACEADSIAAGVAEPAWAPDIAGRHRNELPDDRQGLRVWLIAGALTTAFCLGWAGGSNSDRFLGAGADAGSGAQSVAARSAKPANVASSNVAAETPKPKKIHAGGAAPVERARMPSADPRQPGAPSSHPIASLQQENSAAPGPAAVRTPVPETRPATIAGWTVRDVQRGRATLEGPGGVWQAATGDTVPEVGQIHSIVRWGGNWVVATDKGLIATR